MRRLFWAFPAFFVVLTLNACSDTPVAPAGEAGVVSVPLVFSFEDAAYNGAVASAQFTMPEIGRSVVDHGAVLLYFRDQGTWTALPYTFGVESLDLEAVDFTVSMGFGFDHRLLELFVELSTPEVWDDALDLLPAEYSLKAVIINDRVFSKNGPDMSDYEAVREYYGLPE